VVSISGSSNIAGVEYNKAKQLLIVTFNTGTSYTYEGVDESTVNDLLSAQSMGSYFYRNIRTSYPYFATDRENMDFEDDLNFEEEEKI
jgi:hypothetical protein